MSVKKIIPQILEYVKPAGYSSLTMEDKKEVDKVILTGAELGKYFGKETTPREMKDQIIKLLDDWKDQQKEVAKPEKKKAQPEK